MSAVRSDVGRLSSAALLLWLALADSAAIEQRIPLELREQWEFAGGFCGEVSIQAIALNQGVWVSQNQARQIGGGELLLGVNLETALTKLGFPFESWTIPRRKRRKKFLKWTFRHIMSGTPVIFSARIRGGQFREYDHIMPFYGATCTSESCNSKSDTLIWKTNYGREVQRTVGDRKFSACFRRCKYSALDGGCIDRSGLSQYAAAVSPLEDAHGLFRKLTLVVEGWSSGAAPLAEPLVGSKATMRYTLDVSEGVADGESFTVFMCMGAGNYPANPVSLEDFRTRALQMRCESASHVMHPDLRLGDNTFGEIPSDSVVYFLALLG